jgi:all-trans-retinol 13,14-reductase
MKTVIAAKLALLPILVLWLASAAGFAAVGALAAAVLALGGALWFKRQGRDPIVFWILLAVIALVSVAHALQWQIVVDHAAAATQLGVGLGMAISVALSRPWTAGLAAGAWPGMEKNPLFRRINGILSLLWAGVFAYLAAAQFLHWPALARWGIVAVAGVLSGLLPAFWVRRNLQQRLARMKGYGWQPPDFARQRSQVDVDVAVVGAGLGGLTAAALLAEAGLRVAVFEQYDAPGGFAHCWTRQGIDGDARPVFRFDSGVHDVSGVWEGGTVDTLFRRLGLSEQIDWRRLSYGRVRNGVLDQLPQEWNAWIEHWAQRFPHSAEGIRQALRDIETIFDAMYSGTAQYGGIPGAPESVAAMMAFARQHPLAVRWMGAPLDAFLQHYIADPEARRALSVLSYYISDDPQSVTVGRMAPLFGYHIRGGYYPAGGSGRIVEELVAAIEAWDGAVHVHTPVARMVVEGERVTGVELASGQRLRASAVVMNGDFLSITQLMPDVHWPAEFQELLTATRPATSAFTVHLGVQGGFPGVPPVLHVETTQGPLGIILPSQVDASAAPAGYSTVEIIRLVPHADARQWFASSTSGDDPENAALRRDEAYRRRKKALGDEMIRAAEEVLPGLSSRIVYRAEASPVTFRRYAWTSDGAIYGATGAAFGIAPKSPIGGLVFAGAITNGAGVEAVMISGANAARALVPELLDSAAVDRALPAASAGPIHASGSQTVAYGS